MAESIPSEPDIHERTEQKADERTAGASRNEANQSAEGFTPPMHRS